MLNPHTATVIRRVPLVVSGVEVGVSWEAVGSALGQFTPLESRDGILAGQWRGAVGGDIRRGDRLLIDGVTWVVSGEPLIFNALPPLDHAEWPLERADG
ncbi:MAG: hypothetical protein KF812_02250 [Fimbriimonadaceae bacterium]|nr:hypothetical protein [Fimbriimonadaceae bacterium]